MHQHWSEWLAEKVINEKEEPYVITAGMTTSGPIHYGTLCEFLFPDAIRRALEKRGKRCQYFFIADIFDAFDSVPSQMEKYKDELEHYLGVPLCNVPDPTGESRSFGDHYLDEARVLMGKFGVKAEVVRINEYYEEGRFDSWARFFLKHEADARKIVESTSGKQEKKDWSPIMPVCQNCGRIATTRVAAHDGEEYSYICDKDVGYTCGCGYQGINKISDHKYKLVWRLHWPAWKQVFNTSIEGAGIDHHTRGGSEDTCREITLRLMKADYHIPYRYGFILFKGKKYSKSKGKGMGISEVIKLIPPEIIKYMLLKPDLEENIDINPTPEKLLRTIDEFEKASRINLESEDLPRADRKKAIAFALSTDGIEWNASFLDMMLYYQLYHDWKKVECLASDPEGVAYLRPYIGEWDESNFIPENYRCRYSPNSKKASDNVLDFIRSIDPGMDALEIHNLVFDFSKSRGLKPGELFSGLYLAILGKEKGPRLGKLITAIGIDNVRKDLLGD